MRKCIGYSKELVAQYLVHGRRYRLLSSEQLSEQWIISYRNLARHFSDDNARAIQRDLTSEFWLRNMEPPYAPVDPELAHFVSRLSSAK